LGKIERQVIGGSIRPFVMVTIAYAVIHQR
jgi:hypothetical protein